MDVGLFAPLVGPRATPEFVTALGRLADERGYSSVWLGEHVVLFDEYASRYPYSDDGKMPAVGPTEGLLEPLTTLAFLAAATSTLRLATGLLILPERNPVVVAKELSNIDWLSGGRVTVGVGLGWLREEYDALGAQWRGRADRCRDYVEVLKRLWTEDVSEFSGDHYALPPARMFPKPVQRPHPPIVFGGDSDAALRRVAGIGDGWYGLALTPEALRERLRTLDGLLAAKGRSRSELHVAFNPYVRRVTPGEVEVLGDLGVTELVHTVFGRDVDQLQRRFDTIDQAGLAPGGAHV